MVENDSPLERRLTHAKGVKWEGCTKMVCRTFLKILYERPFNAIRDGKKNIEIRANKNNLSENSVNLIKEGDIIIFNKANSKERFQCVVERKTLYSSVRELLEIEGTEKTLSSTNDINEGIKSIESIENYKQLLSKNGVFAIKLKEITILNN